MTVKKKRVIETRRRWTASDARAVLDAWRQSGEPLQTFARERGLTPQRLYWWRQRLGEAQEQNPAAPKTPDLVPVRLRDVEATLERPTVEVRLAGGVVLDVPPGTPPSWVAALAQALGGP